MDATRGQFDLIFYWSKLYQGYHPRGRGVYVSKRIYEVTKRNAQATHDIRLERRKNKSPTFREATDSDLALHRHEAILFLSLSCCPLNLKGVARGAAFVVALVALGIVGSAHQSVVAFAAVPHSRTTTKTERLVIREGTDIRRLLPDVTHVLHSFGLSYGRSQIA